VASPVFAQATFTLWFVLLAVIAAGALIGFMLVSAIFSVWLERKVAGRIQDRLGPTRVGGKFGWLQTLADGIKLLVKEDIIPAAADHMLFRVGVYIALVGSFMGFLALPFGLGVVAMDLNVGLFFILAVMSSEVFGIILIGYGSGSKWSLFGGMREAAQMVSYEIPMALCAIVPVVVAGTMNLNTVVTQQSGGLPYWYIFHDPFTFGAFWMYFTCAMASCKRAPFDLAEAESELVAGFHTEYSGFRWLVIFMAEYGSMVAVSGIASVMFLGGWSTGLPFEFAELFGGFSWLQWRISDNTIIDWGMGFGNTINVIVFIFKCWFLVFIMMWVRWTLPRLRIDQVMMTCLKYLVPISCTLLVGVSLWQLLLSPYPVAIEIFRWLIFGLSMLGLAWFIKTLITFASAEPGAGMPGMWRMTNLPGYQGAQQKP
jgi:NADH-quinone oxidoreductase subunit H